MHTALSWEGVDIMGYAKHVGRVGALAVALGVGLSVASGGGVAWADEGSAGASDGSDTGDSGDTGGVSQPGPGASADGGSNTGPGTGTGAPAIDRDDPVAGVLRLPGVIVRHSGGAISRVLGGTRGPGAVPGSGASDAAADDTTDDTAGDAADEAPTPIRQRAPRIVADVADVVSQVSAPLRQAPAPTVGNDTAATLGDTTSQIADTVATLARPLTNVFSTAPAAQVSTVTAAVDADPADAITEPVTQVINTLLGAIGAAPSATDDPLGDNPLFLPLVLLNFVRREFEKTFANTAPGWSQDISLTVDENSTDNAVTPLAVDPDGDAIAYTVDPDNGPQHGTVEIVDGAVVYTPDAGYSGADSFTLVASDADNGFHLHGLASLFNFGSGHTGTVTVNVTVAEVTPNVTPVIGAPTKVALDEDTGEVTYSFTVSDDTTPAQDLTVTVAKTAGSTGVLEVDPTTAAGLVVVRFTPSDADRAAAVANGTGTTPLTVTVGDGALQSTATIDAETLPPNQAPVIGAPTQVSYDPVTGASEYTFTVTDDTTPAQDLVVTVAKPAGSTGVLEVDETTAAGLVVVRFTPSVADQVAASGTGTTPLTITVSDGDDESTATLNAETPALPGAELDPITVDTGTDGGQIIDTVVHPGTGKVYATVALLNATQDGYTISIVDTTDGSTVADVYDLALTDINPAATYVLADIDTAIDNDGNIYVVNGGGGRTGPYSVVVVDTADGSTDEIVVDGVPVSLTTSPDGAKVFAKVVKFEYADPADPASPHTGSVVSVVDLANPGVPAGTPHAIPADSAAGQFDVGALQSSLVVDSDGNVYTVGGSRVTGSDITTDLLVWDADGNLTVTEIDDRVTGIGGDADGDVFVMRQVFDETSSTYGLLDVTTGNTVFLTDGSNSIFPNELADPVVSRAGDRVLVGTQNGVVVIDTATGDVIDVVTLVPPPGSILAVGEPYLSPDGTRAYIPRITINQDGSAFVSDIAVVAISSNPPAPVVV